MPKILMLDFPRWIPRRAENNVLDRQSKVQEFRHDVQHVLHSRVHAANVQVCRNGIGQKTLVDGGHRLIENETATTMSHVENDAAFLGFKQIGQHFSACVEHVNEIEVHVGGDVARTKSRTD